MDRNDFDCTLHKARSASKLLVESCVGAAQISEHSTFVDQDLLFEGLADLARQVLEHLTEMKEAIEDGHIVLASAPASTGGQ